MRISDWSSDVCSSDLTKLEQVVPEAWQMLSKDEMKELNQKNQEHHLKRWHEIGKVKFLHEEDLTKMGVKVTYAGMRSRYPEKDQASPDRKSTRLNSSQ